MVRKVDANASAILWVGVTSTTLDALELSDFLKRVYVDRLSTVPGVANVISAASGATPCGSGSTAPRSPPAA